MKDMKAFLVPVSLSAFPIGSHYPWPYNEIQCDADEMIPGLLLRFMNIFPWKILKVCCFLQIHESVKQKGL